MNKVCNGFFYGKFSEEFVSVKGELMMLENVPQLNPLISLLKTPWTCC